jgi:hypothetical protein
VRGRAAPGCRFTKVSIIAAIASRCESNQRAITYVRDAHNAAHTTVVPAPKRIEPPNASLKRMIEMPASRSSSNSIAGTNAKLAAIVETINKTRSKEENAA